MVAIMVTATPVTTVSGSPALKVSTVSCVHSTPTCFWISDTIWRAVILVWADKAAVLSASPAAISRAVRSLIWCPCSPCAATCLRAFHFFSHRQHLGYAIPVARRASHLEQLLDRRPGQFRFPGTVREVDVEFAVFQMQFFRVVFELRQIGD